MEPGVIDRVVSQCQARVTPQYFRYHLESSLRAPDY